MKKIDLAALKNTDELLSEICQFIRREYRGRSSYHKAITRWVRASDVEQISDYIRFELYAIMNAGFRTSWFLAGEDSGKKALVLKQQLEQLKIAIELPSWKIKKPSVEPSNREWQIETSSTGEFVSSGQLEEFKKKLMEISNSSGDDKSNTQQNDAELMHRQQVKDFQSCIDERLEMLDALKFPTNIARKPDGSDSLSYNEEVEIYTKAMGAVSFSKQDKELRTQIDRCLDSLLERFPEQFPERFQDKLTQCNHSVNALLAEMETLTSKSQNLLTNTSAIDFRLNPDLEENYYRLRQALSGKDSLLSCQQQLEAVKGILENSVGPIIEDKKPIASYENWYNQLIKQEANLEELQKAVPIAVEAYDQVFTEYDQLIKQVHETQQDYLKELEACRDLAEGWLVDIEEAIANASYPTINPQEVTLDLVLDDDIKKEYQQVSDVLPKKYAQLLQQLEVVKVFESNLKAMQQEVLDDRDINSKHNNLLESLEDKVSQLEELGKKVPEAIKEYENVSTEYRRLLDQIQQFQLAFWQNNLWRCFHLIHVLLRDIDQTSTITSSLEKFYLQGVEQVDFKLNKEGKKHHQRILEGLTQNHDLLIKQREELQTVKASLEPISKEIQKFTEQPLSIESNKAIFLQQTHWTSIIDIQNFNLERLFGEIDVCIKEREEIYRAFKAIFENEKFHIDETLQLHQRIAHEKAQLDEENISKEKNPQANNELAFEEELISKLMKLTDSQLNQLKESLEIATRREKLISKLMRLTDAQLSQLKELLKISTRREKLISKLMRLTDAQLNQLKELLEISTKKAGLIPELINLTHFQLSQLNEFLNIPTEEALTKDDLSITFVDELILALNNLTEVQLNQLNEFLNIPTQEALTEDDLWGAEAFVEDLDCMQEKHTGKLLRRIERIINALQTNRKHADIEKGSNGIKKELEKIVNQLKSYQLEPGEKSPLRALDTIVNEVKLNLAYEDIEDLLQEAKKALESPLPAVELEENEKELTDDPINAQEELALDDHSDAVIVEDNVEAANLESLKNRRESIQSTDSGYASARSSKFSENSTTVGPLSKWLKMIAREKLSTDELLLITSFANDISDMQRKNINSGYALDSIKFFENSTVDPLNKWLSMVAREELPKNVLLFITDCARHVYYIKQNHRKEVVEQLESGAEILQRNMQNEKPSFKRETLNILYEGIEDLKEAMQEILENSLLSVITSKSPKNRRESTDSGYDASGSTTSLEKAAVVHQEVSQNRNKEEAPQIDTANSSDRNRDSGYSSEFEGKAIHHRHHRKHHVRETIHQATQDNPSNPVTGKGFFSHIKKSWEDAKYAQLVKKNDDGLTPKKPHHHHRRKRREHHSGNRSTYSSSC